MVAPMAIVFGHQLHLARLAEGYGSTIHDNSHTSIYPYSGLQLTSTTDVAKKLNMIMCGRFNLSRFCAGQLASFLLFY